MDAETALRRSCLDKAIYFTREEAWEAVELLQEELGLDVGRPYPCLHCAWWHTGHRHGRPRHANRRFIYTPA